MKNARQFDSIEARVEKEVLEVVDEYLEWSRKPMSPSEVKTLIWDANEKSAIVMNTQGQIEKRFKADTVDSLIGKIEAEGLTPIAQVTPGPRIVVPVVPGRPIAGPRPIVVPEAPVPDRPESQIEYLRRRIEATLSAMNTTFSFEVLYHIKPLIYLDGLKAEFFSGVLREGESTNIRSSFYGIPLWFFASVKIATNTDYLIETIDTSSGFSLGSITYSRYGSGEVSLDQAVELLMSSLSAGYFDFVDTTNQSILRIPTVNWKNNFAMVDVERSVIHQNGNIYYIAKSLHFTNEANVLSFDLLGYARKVGMRYHITYVPGNHYIIKFEGNFQPSTAIYGSSPVSTESILSEYFFNQSDKAVPGYIQISMPTVIFGSPRA